MAFTQLATSCQTGAVSGTLAVPSGALSVTVIVAVNASTYTPTVSPNWNTTWWVSSKTTTQFVVQFGTPAPDNGTGSIDWFLTGL